MLRDNSFAVGRLKIFDSPVLLEVSASSRPSERSVVLSIGFATVAVAGFVVVLLAEFPLCIGLVFENIALGKPTFQSNPYISHIFPHSLFDSGKAVDRLKTNLSGFGGECTLSDNGHKIATWLVNLKSIHSIHDIKIYYRTDNAPWGPSNGYTARFLGFYVYISNTTSRHDGHLCFHDTMYTNATIPAVVNITCPVHGQYVIYYNERPQMSHAHASELSSYAHTELCELEVHGR
ncbi:uncharacterized protein LOC134257523 [Saccostrea cucullata]|uniref:uncharacterized protein LOC134257523 n=1 Tax=Saccostrea cuccullata TaxID=36930 RepID=UPI002ED23F41